MVINNMKRGKVQKPNKPKPVIPAPIPIPEEPKKPRGRGSRKNADK